MLLSMAWTEVAPYIFTSIAALATAFLCYFLKPYWLVRKVPGPPITPLLGHLPLLQKYGPDIFIRLAKEYGPIYRFHLGRQPLVVLADPELVREAGVKKFKDMPNRNTLVPLGTAPIHLNNLFMTKDTKWSKMRSTLTPLYQPKRVTEEFPLMKPLADNLIANIERTVDEEFNFSELSLQMSVDTIGKSAFGFDFELSKQSSSKDVNQRISDFINQHMYAIIVIKMDMTATFSTIVGFFIPFLQLPIQKILKILPWTSDSKRDKNDKILTDQLDGIIMERSRGCDTSTNSNDFLSLLLDANNAEKANITSLNISSLAYEHLLAGSATVSFTLSTILYLLSDHQEVERKLLKEIDDFGPHDVLPTAHDLQYKFPYLNQIIKEAMRVFIVSPLVSRETNKEVQLAGYTFPKGTWIWFAIGAMAKDPKQFPEPYKFIPERFDPNCDEEKRRHPYANSPFGIGPRACIGQNLGLQEVRLSTFLLYRKFTFRHSPNMEKPLALVYGITCNFKYGVKLIAKRRK